MEAPSEERQRSLLDPKKTTPPALYEAALRYLDRQDGAVEQVRRSLRRRVYRYGEKVELARSYQDIEDILARLVESNLLNDTRFALALALSCRRKGASERKVRQKLHARGLSSENIDAAIESLSEDKELSEEASALHYVKKRRLRERFDLQDDKQRNKALASLARQGFSYEVAKGALDL